MSARVKEPMVAHHRKVRAAGLGASGIGASMAGGNPNAARGRSKGDFYATPFDTADALLAAWGHHVSGVVWEPCAGNGKLATRILSHPNVKGVRSVLCTDIEPRPASEWFPGVKIAPLDLFSVQARADGEARFDCIITNPPFDIAADVIEHIFARAEPSVRFVALLLKATYWHAKSRLALFHAFPPSIIAPLTFRPDFLDAEYRAANPEVAGPTMELAWNIWIAGNLSTSYAPIERGA